MKAITREWLARAADDLAAADVLLSREDLTNIVAFHAQQAVEKAFKAAIEELDLGPPRTHSLSRLYEIVRPDHPVVADADMLDRLEAVYIEARYPGDMGLLPYGKPTPEDSLEFYHFARDVCRQIRARLKKGIYYRLALGGGEGRYDSFVLPGFWLRVEWLWQEPLPHPLRLLGEIANLDPQMVERFLQALGGTG